jgi:hypothetical protein
MKEIGPPPRKYRLQGFLRNNTPIYEKITGFQVDYRNHSRLSIFLFHVSLSLGAWQGHAIYASVSGKRSYSGSDFVCTKLLAGKKEESKFVSKDDGFLHLGRADLWERSLSN